MRPGVYVSEDRLPRVAPIAVSTGTYGAFIGTAVMGPQKPYLVRSWNDFISVFGGFAANKTLPLAMYQYFSNGGAPAWVARVLGSSPAAIVATVKLTLGTAPAKDYLRIDATTAGLWGNYINVKIVTHAAPNANLFDIEVSQDIRGTPVLVEKFNDLVLDPDDVRYAPKIVNSTTIGSQFIFITDLTDSSTNALPVSTSVTVELVGGTDGGAVADASYTTAIQEFGAVEAMLVFNIPGVSNTTPVLQYIEERGDSVLIVDTAENLAPTDPSIPTGLTSSYTAVYYPWIYIPDPSPDAPRGSIIKVPPGASVAGMILRTDAVRGVFKAPAGQGAVLANAVANERRLTNAELDTLSSNNINAVIPVQGVGIAAMGARTKSQDTAQFLSVRRTLNYVKYRAGRVSRFAMFEPNTPDLWEQVRVVNGAFLSDLWEKGGLVGYNSAQAYYVKCDEENNPVQTVMNGELHIEIGVSPTFPAEFVIIRVGQFEADASVLVIEEV
jgi:Bacteriophage tail sheath protein